MHVVILGDGLLGRAVAAALADRGDTAELFGRPRGPSHGPDTFERADAVVDASRGGAVADNVAAALASGVRRMVIATTGWDAQRSAVDAALRNAGAAAVAAPNLSLGAALFGRLVESAAAIFGAAGSFDAYLVEWHRRGKVDRPSGTARTLGGRIVVAHPAFATVAEQPSGTSDASALEVVGVRAGSNPGSHLVGFDGPGEAIELSHTARDRTAYAAGALAALDWLIAASRPAGLHPMDEVVDDLLARHRPGGAMAT